MTMKVYKTQLLTVIRATYDMLDHASWMAVVTPTDRPKSVHNRCVIELFCCAVCVVTLPFWHFCGCRGFCHGTESDLSLFLWRQNVARGRRPMVIFCLIFFLICWPNPLSITVLLYLHWLRIKYSIQTIHKQTDHDQTGLNLDELFGTNKFYCELTLTPSHLSTSP